MFGVGHLVKQIVAYGITSPKALIRVFKLQGGEASAGYGGVDFSAKYSADKKTELFDVRGSYYYDRDQFHSMVCSFTKLLDTVKVY